MANSSFSNTYLLAFVTDAQSAGTIHAVLETRGMVDVRVEAGTLIEATAFLKDNPSPRFLIVELPTAKPAPELLDALADVVNPNTKVIVVGTTDTLTFYQWLIGLGIHEYLLAPLTQAPLEAALNKGTGPAIVTAETAPQVKKLVGIIGARGGVGTTTIATNLAALCAEYYGVATGLIDLDAHFGSVALSLDLEPGRGMRDALEKAGPGGWVVSRPGDDQALAASFHF